MIDADAQRNQRFQIEGRFAREGVGQMETNVKAEKDVTITYMEIVKRVLAEIRYKDWGFEITTVRGTKPEPGDMAGNNDLFLRVAFVAPDNVTGAPEMQYGRKWLIEYGSHPTQIVQAAWLAVQRAEMHETAETFKYKGAAVFNRHLDVDELVKISNRVD